MCIPPQFKSPNPFFKELNLLNKELKLQHLSIGMSADYITAIESSATYLRIGSKIFGKRNIKY